MFLPASHLQGSRPQSCLCPGSWALRRPQKEWLWVDINVLGPDSSSPAPFLPLGRGPMAESYLGSCWKFPIIVCKCEGADRALQASVSISVKCYSTWFKLLLCAWPTPRCFLCVMGGLIYTLEVSRLTLSRPYRAGRHCPRTFSCSLDAHSHFLLWLCRDQGPTGAGVHVEPSGR